MNAAAVSQDRGLCAAAQGAAGSGAGPVADPASACGGGVALLRLAAGRGVRLRTLQRRPVMVRAFWPG